MPKSALQCLYVQLTLSRGPAQRRCERKAASDSLVQQHTAVHCQLQDLLHLIQQPCYWIRLCRNELQDVTALKIGTVSKGTLASITVLKASAS